MYWENELESLDRKNLESLQVLRLKKTIQSAVNSQLVMTTLDREAMPLIRYRTRDLTRILPGDCPCGRTHVRLDRITGRSDDMFMKEIVKAEVNFTNAYGRSGYGNEKAYFVIDTEDVVDARKKLQLAGLSLLSDESIYGIS